MFGVYEQKKPFGSYEISETPTKKSNIIIKTKKSELKYQYDFVLK